MTSTAQQLKALKPAEDFFIGIDSDGCAFDTMEPKHKECFCPTTIWKWNLEAVGKYARETWDFVNLYGRTRGATVSSPSATRSATCRAAVKSRTGDSKSRR